MFNEELVPTMKFEESLSLQVIRDLSKLLVNEYSSRNNLTIYKKHDLVIQLSNIIGLLFQRFIFTQYNRRCSPTIAFPNAKNLYYDSKQYTHEKYDIVKSNIASFGLSSRRKDQLLSIIEFFNLCTITKGIYKLENSTTTILRLNPIEEWNSFIFSHRIDLNYGIYSALYENYLTAQIFKNSDPYNFISAVVKKDKKTYIPANDNDIRLVNELNSLFPEELQSSLHYKKIYSKQEYRGGRLYSIINTMKKEHREILLEQLNYVEIDFPSFVPNLMHRVVDGTTFPERAYTLVARQIIHNKTRTKVLKPSRQLWMNCYEDLLSDIIKTPVITLFNSNVFNPETFHFELFEESKAILIDNGLLNSYEDRKSTAPIWNSGNHANACLQVGEYLRNLRKTRWESKHGTIHECPHFTVSLENIYKAMKTALKSIRIFLLKENWDWTQFLEAEFLHMITNDIKEDKLLPIFVHDAFYVPAEFELKYRNRAEEYISEIANKYRNSINNTTDLEKMYCEFKIMIEDNCDIKNIVKTYILDNSTKKVPIHKIAQRIHKELKPKIELFKSSVSNIIMFCNKDYWYELGLVKEVVKSHI